MPARERTFQTCDLAMKNFLLAVVSRPHQGTELGDVHIYVYLHVMCGCAHMLPVEICD
jgi:hypothetical protein